MLTKQALAQPDGSTATSTAQSVVIAPVVEASIRSGRRVVGNVQPLRTATIGSATDGRVLHFYVNHGDAVTQGQPLAQLRTETLEIELRAALAEQKLYEEQLAELENGSRPEEIDEVRARMMGAKAAKEIAESRLKRLQSLIGSGATSEITVDDAREQAAFTRFALQATEALLEQAVRGPRAERIAQARAQVELQQQKVALIKDRISKHTIVAPFDGYVSEEYTEVGAWITQGDPVAQVIQLDEVEVRIPALAEYAKQLVVGDTIRIEFPELPDQLLTGTVDRIVPVAESSTRTFPIYLRLANPVHEGTPLLMAGMLARVDLPAGRRETTPLVLKDALVLNESSRSVFVLEPESKSSAASPAPAGGNVRQVAVQLGVASGGMIQVLGDIRPGSWVVTVGNERLRDGDLVSVTKVVDIPASELPVTAASR